MKNEFRILNVSRTYLIKPLLIILIINLIGYPILVLYGSEKSAKMAMLVLGFVTLVLYLGPLIVIFINYWTKNKETVFRITGYDSFEYIHQGSIIKFDLSDVNNIQVFQSIPKYKNNARLFFWDEYYYAKVNIKDGTSLIITCLLCDNIYDLFPKNKFERKALLFPMVK